MRRGQDYGTQQELNEVQKYGQGSLSLIGCKVIRTNPSYKVYDYCGDPIRVYDEPIVQLFSLRLKNNSDAPVQVNGVETRVWNYWCMRPIYSFTVDYCDTGCFDVLLDRTGTRMHPVKSRIAPYATIDLNVSVASSISHIKCYTLYDMDLCVHYNGDSQTEDSDPMVLAINHYFRDYDTTPGNDGYDPRNPFNEKIEDVGLPKYEQDWRALKRFGNYSGKRNMEFLREYAWYQKFISEMPT